MIVTIDVTAEDIEQGTRCNCHSCPVARAISRATLADYVSVSVKYARFIKHGTPLIELPAIAQCKIEDFDTGFKIRPFSFELDIPAELVRQEAVHGE